MSRLPLIAGTLLGLVVAHGGHTAEVPDPVIQEATLDHSGLRIKFSEPMLTWRGKSVPSSVAVSPPLDCNWSWTDDTELVCYDHLGSTLPATTYSITIRDGLWSQQGRQLQAQRLEVESLRPEIEYASIERWIGGFPILQVSTNVPVTKEALRAVLELNADTRAVGFKVNPEPARAQGDAFLQHANWSIEPLVSDADAHELVLKVHTGLRTRLGPLAGTQDKVLMRAFINEPFQLRQISCASSHSKSNSPQSGTVSKDPDMPIGCPAGQRLELEFSHALAPDSLDRLRSNLPTGLRFAGSVAAYSRTWYSEDDPKVLRRPGHWIYLGAEHPSQDIRFTLPDSLKSDAGDPLVRPELIKIAVGDYLPSLGIAPEQMLLPVGSELPKVISARNVPEYKFTQFEIGAHGMTKRSRTQDSDLRNALVLHSPPEPDPRIRMKGGLVAGELSQANVQYPTRQHYAFAIAPFNVTASVAGKHVLVWLTDWNGARPLRGARVELLHLVEPESISVLDSTTTDASGVTLLEMRPTQPETEGGTLLVRASHDGKQTILPFNSQIDRLQTDASSSYFRATEDGASLDWGISDRPIYRPGDTVRYRLWQRERQQNHLRMPAVLGEAVLRLREQYGIAAILEFTATPDRFGSMSGDFVLPESIHDNNYCLSIESAPYAEKQGVCFRVTGYHTNNLWVELNADRKLIRENEAFVLDAEAGYYSGGAAAGARTEIQSLLTPLRFEDAYPEFRDFTFVDPYADTNGDAGESINDALHGNVFTDSKGHAVRSVTLAPASMQSSSEQESKRIPFGTIEFNVSASTSASNWATAPASAKFSRHPRYVGLKVLPWLLGDDADPDVEAVVATDDGKLVDDVPVDIEISKVTWEAETGEVEESVAFNCRMRSGRKGHCPFRPAQSGHYKFVANSPGAVAASLGRFASVDDTPNESDPYANTSLSTENVRPAIGSTAELVLQQPFAKAVVLFSIEHGRVLKHWIQHVHTPVVRIPLFIEKEWSPGATVNAVILNAKDEAFGPHSPKDSLVQMASIALHFDKLEGPAPLAVTASPANILPGESVRIRLHNPRSSEAQVTLAIVDDSARALVPEFIHRANPASEAWLGKLASWRVPAWYGLANWERWAGSLSNSQARPLLFATEIDPNAPYSERLDTIVVTGSSISAADVFQKATPVDRPLGRPQRGTRDGSALRSHFSETALWKTDLVLAAGAEQTIELRLPDNLTRWRVLAWAADADDGFSLSETTIEASLPIEIRSEAPSRLFPGDRSTIGASVRANGNEAVVDAVLQAEGAGVSANTRWKAPIAANAQRTISIVAIPESVGEISVSARASSDHAVDGISASVEVSSPMVRQRVPVAGWLPADGVELKLPTLPDGAIHPRLDVHVSRGLLALAGTWTEGLRDYPHRCWEQILSRAVGAAAAIRLGLADPHWPDASAAIEEALRSAGQFQDSEGGFHFFVGEYGSEISAPSTMLTAYTIQSFAFLRSTGYEVPANIDESARKGLAQMLGPHLLTRKTAGFRFRDEEDIFALAVLGTDMAVSADSLDTWWLDREKLSWYGRSNLGQVLASRAGREEQARKLVGELRLAGEKRGMARSIANGPSAGWPFHSSAMDQCGILRALRKLDHATDAPQVLASFQRGLADLYAGGSAQLDTQASAQCLMGVSELSTDTSRFDAPIAIDLSAGKFSKKLVLEPGLPAVAWSQEFPNLPPKLNVRMESAQESLLSYVANLKYDIDGRFAPPVAVGFSLQRQYSVMRKNAWMDVPAEQVREGDWVRVTLRLSTTRFRHFVAITDSVPGGLRPTDLELAGMGNVDLNRLAADGSPWFPARQIDDRHARFYSEQLPPGTHEVHYYTRASFAGEYTALPAIAELMYGESTVSRSSSATISIERDSSHFATPSH